MYQFFIIYYIKIFEGFSSNKKMDPWWDKPIFFAWWTLTNSNPLDINPLIPLQGSGIACIGKAWEWHESEKIEVDHCFCGLIENSYPAILHAGRELCLDEGLEQDYGFRVRAWSLYVSNMRILRD